MSEVTLTIGGRRHTVSCAAGEEAHIAELGDIIDAKLKQMGAAASQDSKNLLFASLLLADELHEARSASSAAPVEPDENGLGQVQARLAELERDAAQKDAELADARSAAADEIKTLQAQVSELLAQKESVRAANEGLQAEFKALENERDALAAAALSAEQAPPQDSGAHAGWGQGDLAPALERFADLLENCADKLEG